MAETREQSVMSHLVAGRDGEPKLRHEFVGMMFAVTIGEVGLQAAALVQAKYYCHFLPFYSHLTLATIIVTSSWVGWSLSQARGARQDVKGVYTSGFITLLLDVSLVVTYFIMVRAVELGKGNEKPRIDSSGHFASLMCFMFVLYIAWDIITKFVAGERPAEGKYVRNGILRMIPTITCLIIALVIRHEIMDINRVHYIDADFALLALALLFRSLKDFVSERFPSSGASVSKGKVRKAIIASALLTLGICVGTASAKHSWPILPSKIAHEIETEPPPSLENAVTKARGGPTGADTKGPDKGPTKDAK